METQAANSDTAAMSIERKSLMHLKMERWQSG